MHDKSLEHIENALKKYLSTHDAGNNWHDNSAYKLNSAAVLLLLVQEQAKWSFVFIERAQNPDDIHSGQVAFPGGRTETDDADFIATALRETKEEIGLIVEPDNVIGLLPMMLSRKQYKVRPVIAAIQWPQHTVLQTTEVADVFTLPLEWLADKSNLESATVMGLPESATTVYREYHGRRLWGLTAVMVNEFINIISRY